MGSVGRAIPVRTVWNIRHAEVDVMYPLNPADFDPNVLGCDGGAPPFQSLQVLVLLKWTRHQSSMQLGESSPARR